MDPIKYDDFAKLDIRIAKIKAAELVEGTDKLLKLTLDVAAVGEDETSCVLLMPDQEIAPGTRIH